MRLIRDQMVEAADLPVQFLRLTAENIGSLGPGLSSLHYEQTGQLADPAHWKWRYLDGPCGPGATSVALRGDRVIGRFGSIPVPFQIKGAPTKAVLLEGLSVLAADRSWSTYRGLLEKTTTENLVSGVSLGYSFATHRGLKMNRHLGWNVFSPVAVFAGFLDFAGAFSERTGLGSWALPLGILQPLFGLRRGPAGPERYRIAQLAEFDSSIDDIWSETCEDLTGVAKDSRYLQWRYGTCPDREYRTIGVFEGSVLAGYTVFRRILEFNEICLLELVVRRKDRSLGQILLQQVAEVGRRGSAALIRASFPSSSWEAGLLRQAGFQQWVGHLARMHLVLMKNENLPLDSATWHYSLGDWLYY